MPRPSFCHVHVYHMLAVFQILVISTLALWKTSWLITLPLSTALPGREGAFKVIRAYVPAPRRLDRYPGLITSTLSTTY